MSVPFSSASLTSVKINGREESEVGISALVAGELGVPVIMASGDDMLAEEIAGTLGPLVDVAVVKEALSYHSANTMRPEDAQALVKTTAARSLERLKAGDHSPLYTTDTPITLDISTKNCARVFVLHSSMCLLTAAAFSSLPDRPIEMLAFLPQVERVDSHTARFEVPDMAAAVRSECRSHAHKNV